MKCKHFVLGASLLFSVHVFAGGPVGIGALKIGISKAQVEALPQTGEVYLESPMTPFDYKNIKPTPGEDRFDTTLHTPLASDPLKATLTFKQDTLIGIYLTLKKSTGQYDNISKKIVEKYGGGKVDDGRKEEQCIYKNGSNFKLNSGRINTTWVEEVSPSERIETELMDITIAVCPSNLRYGTIDPIVLQSLAIRQTNPGAQSKPKNPF